MGASNFDELRTIRTKSFREEAQCLREDIVRLIQEECTLRDNASMMDEKSVRIVTLTFERDGLEKQLSANSSHEEEDIETEYFAVLKALTEAQQELANDKHTLQEIADIRVRVSAFSTQMDRFYDEIQSQLHNVGVPEIEHDAFRPKFSGDTGNSLESRRVALEQDISALSGTAENPVEGTIHQLSQKVAELQMRQTTDKALQEKIRTMQSRIVQINSEIGRINAEIDRIQGQEKIRIENARLERRDAYTSFFGILKREQETLQELYKPVVDRLNAETASEHEQQLDFSIRWIADVDKWIERGRNLFDLRKKIPYETIDGLEHAARRILVPAWLSGDANQIGPAMDEFLVGFRSLDNPHPEAYLRSDVSYTDILQWLYEVQHVSLSYSLKYGGTELENLSPGTKGIVLLILYLGIDDKDTRPMIVDQPDENLDNESIFELLERKSIWLNRRGFPSVLFSDS